MLHCSDGIGLVISGAWFPPNMTPGIHTNEFNLCLIRPENFVSHGLRVLQVHFGKLQAGCHVPFTKEWLPSGHSTIPAWLVDCCRGGCPSGRFSSLHRGTLELWQSDHWVLPRRPLCSLGPSKQQKFFCTLPQICSSRQSCLWGLQTIPLTSRLVCALTCTVNCGTLYRLEYAFPKHVQSAEFTTGGLQLSCRNISRMISGNLFEVNGKGCEYLWTCDFLVFLFLIHLQKTFFTLLLWVGEKAFNPFWNKAVT